MKKLISISLVFFLQIGLNYCLSEQISPECNHTVSEEVGHHDSHGHNETDHHDSESTCCDNFNLIYSNTSRILLEKNVKYQYPGNDIYLLSIVDILTAISHKVVILANCGPPYIPKNFYLSVFSCHAPPFFS